MKICFRAFVVLAAALCSLHSGAFAETRLQVGGGGVGDRPMEDRCAASQTLVGFSARSGDWIDAVAAICAPLAPDGRIGQGIVMEDRYFGGPGGGRRDSFCPAGWYLERVAYTPTRGKKQVASIELACRNQANGQIDTSRTAGNPAYVAECDEKGIFVADCTLEFFAVSNICPQGELPVGFHGRVGQHVNQLGLICDRVVAPPAPLAAPPPRGTFKTTRKAVSTPPARAPGSSAGLVLRASIAGSWRIEAGDRRYTLVLQARGNGLDPSGRDTLPLAVAGQLIDPDDIDGSGGLQGVVAPSRVMGAQVGTKGSAAGSCQLAYADDGQSLEGNCVQDGQSISWRGTRGSWPARAAAPAPAPAPDPAPGPAPRAVTVLLDVDLFPQAGGEGEAIGTLNAGTPAVTLVEPCRGGWCHVRWPGREGWVYSAEDYRSLDD